jgi:Trk K+ transport system NAD-binding subunit
MQPTEPVILFGSGHLALQIGRKLRSLGHTVVEIAGEAVRGGHASSQEESIVEYSRRLLAEAALERARAVYVVDREDRFNIQFALIVLSINETVPVFVSLYHQELAGQLQASRARLVVRNPAMASTNLLVDALHTSLNRPARAPVDARVAPEERFSEMRRHPWLYALVVIFAALLIAGTIAFHETNFPDIKPAGRLSWIDAFYFTVTVMTTTGFGDINLANSSPAAKLFGAALMLSAVILASLTFSFIADRLFKKRAEIALGRRRHRMGGHVIVCGFGRVGYHVLRELIARGEKVLVIERDADHRHLDQARALGARTFVGDASLPRVLLDAGVQRACGLFSLIDDDLKNLEIGLNARSLRRDLRLILRIFDSEIAEQMRARLDIHFAFSTSAVAADEFVSLLESESATN